MTKFEKQFLLKCLGHLDTIISDEAKVAGAVLVFNQVKPGEPPHDFPQKFTDVENWSGDEKTSLAAAILLAISITSREVYTDHSLEKALGDATGLFLKVSVPLITKHTESGKRLEGVKSNIERAIADINKPKLKSDEGISNVSFFAAVGVIAVVAAAAIKLSRPN